MWGLLRKYASLPPEARILLAMAGLGTPIGLIYALSKLVRPWGIQPHELILYLAGLFLLVALVSFLVSKAFSRTGRKRQRRMEAELATGAETGPVSMDVRAAIKANNEKFFTAVRELRKNKIHVYDLPWYTVIGDSGCGKTELVNRSGLTFSLGKPEGYQLGTLNYNWWFTEDAIFLDMAGRLCNPQEDADYREWQAFLKTVAAGRRGFPINGVVACVSAEHLLLEPPEKHEADANTMPERLRDLQSKLGVTFATYLVVTKCDKIPGFMQFFESAEVDVRVKHQIFGWSRPGAFHEPWDPEQFAPVFDGIYQRLNELRLRRLNDEADENELGLVHSFPEEFRLLKGPLETYVRTLFPLMKSPRVIKNLLFRGVYFTSATQKGGLILRRLADRLGEDEAAKHFAPLEHLWPNPRPHFVRDLLLQKAFPEQGLVFRNEREVLRHRKLARILTVGTAALAVALVAMLVVSGVKFNSEIGDPSRDANHVREQWASLTKDPAQALEYFGRLGRHVQTLEGSWWAPVLSVRLGTRVPVDNLRYLQARLFEQGVLPAVLGAVEEGLREAKIHPAYRPDKGAAGETPGMIDVNTYQRALYEYVAWYASTTEEKKCPTAVSAASLGVQCNVVREDHPLHKLIHQTLLALDQGQTQVTEYFKVLARVDPARKLLRNPARFLLSRREHAKAVIQKAVEVLHGHLKQYAMLDAHAHPDETVRAWMRICNGCVQAQKSYEALLGLSEAADCTMLVDVANGRITTFEDMQTAASQFDTNYGKFKAALDGLKNTKWHGTRGKVFVTIPEFRAAVLTQRRLWQTCQNDLISACPEGSDARTEIQTITSALSAGDGQRSPPLQGLDEILWNSLQSAGLAKGLYATENYEHFDKSVQEVHEAHFYIIELKPGEENADGAIQLRSVADEAAKVLESIAGQLQSATTTSGKPTLSQWERELGAILDACDRTDDQDAAKALDGLRKSADKSAAEKWLQNDRLEKCYNQYSALLTRRNGTLLLKSILEEANRMTKREWGLAELCDDWSKLAEGSSEYEIRLEAAAPEVRPAPPPADTPARDQPPERRRRRRTEGPDTGAESPAAGKPVSQQPQPPGARLTESARTFRDTDGVIRCATANFLQESLVASAGVLGYLSDLGETPPCYLPSRDEGAARLNQQCTDAVKAAWKKYVSEYAQRWKRVYDAKSLKLPQDSELNAGWNEAARAAGKVRDQVSRQYKAALAGILRQTRYWAVGLADDADFHDEMASVRRALDEALDARWKEHEFVRASPSREREKQLSTNRAPWDPVADDMASAWEKLAEAVFGAADLPRHYHEKDVSTERGKIEWGKLKKMADEYGLGGEKLSAQLLKFEGQLQQALSAELTGIFAGIQDEHLHGEPYEGWPYLKKDGTGETALEVVDFDNFNKFLREANLAKKALGPLDWDKLPNQQTRAIFLKQCEEWRQFLFKTESDPVPIAEITITLDSKDTNAQQCYNTACVDLGLSSAVLLKESGGDSGASQGALEFGTETPDKRRSYKARWDWSMPSRGSDQYFTFTFKDGGTPESKDWSYGDPPTAKVLGRMSPLGLCAYLHRYGQKQSDNRSWTVRHEMHANELIIRGDPDEQEMRNILNTITTGKMQLFAKFTVVLPPGRGLPDPITPLRETGSARSAADD